MNKNKVISFITALSLVFVMICPTLSVVAEGETALESEETTEIAETIETTEVMETTTIDETVETTEVTETTTITEDATTTGDVETTEATETTTTVETSETTDTETTTVTTEITTEIETGIVENITVPDGMFAEIDDAVKYVPYSFLLYNTNYPTEIKEPEPDIPDKTVTVPAGLKAVEKGHWGNYAGDMYSDGSLLIHSTMESVGESLTIPSSVGGHPIREIVIIPIPSFWKGAKNITVPDGVAFSIGSEAVSYSNAISMFAIMGITLEIQGWSNTAQNVSDVTEGRLPDGLQFYPDSLEVYGIPLETGTFVFSINDIYDGILVDENGETLNIDTDVSFELTVKNNDNQTVFDETDEGYSILDSIGTDVGNHDYVLEAPVESVYRSEGEFEEFVNVWLNGQLLVRDEDYEAESGSTKITIYAQTFETKANQQGINTIAAEFRTTDINALNTIHDTNKLHVTAQNFRLKNENETVNNFESGQNTGNTDNSASSSSSSSSKDVVSSTGMSPSTGDKTPISLYVTIGFVSVVAFMATRTSKKTKDDENI